MADKKILVNVDFGGNSSIKNLPSATPASSDCLAITDDSDGGKVKKGPAIGSNDGKFLRHDGSWASPGDANYYHTTGTWSGLTYTAAKVGSPGDLVITIPTGTSASTVCVGNDSRLSDARPASDVSAWAKAASKPSYAFSEITDRGESWLGWGGRSISGSVTPIGMALSNEHSGNKLAFINGACLNFEYSADAGSTWTNYNYSNSQKSTFCTKSFAVPIGRTSGEYTTNSRTRVTLTAQDGTNGYVYTDPVKMLINISSSGSMNVLVEYRTGTNYKSGGAWSTLGTYALSGWSGWNDIPLVLSTLGGGTSQTSNIWQLRLTFIMTSKNTQYPTTASVQAVRIYGRNNWTTPSTMAETNHLYAFDMDKNASFPAGVSATTFTENGTALSDKYLALAGGIMTGPLKWAGASRELLCTAYNDGTWKGGIKYSWSSNTTTAIWGKHKMSQFVWNAGTDFSATDVNGTTTKTYDFQVGRDASDGAPIGRIGGNIIATQNWVSDNYLGKTATAADSSKLNNQAASYYLDYNNLTNKPTIPAAQVNSDWNASSGVAQILNKPTLATVATSGSYNDLTNKPTIPSVSNATITVKQSGRSDQTFTLNGSATTINLDNTTYSNATTSAAGLMSSTDKTKLDGIATGATKVIESTVSGWGFTKNAGTVTSVDSVSPSSGNVSLSAVRYVAQTLTDAQKSQARSNIGAGTSNFSGSYSDLTNKPTIPAAQVNSDWNATSGVAQILNKPTIPTVNNGTLTIQKNGTQVATFSANQSSNATANITVPTKDSDITNDRYVRYDTNAQGLTATQKSNARTNIGAGTSNLTLGNTASTAAAGNHNHDSDYLSLTGGELMSGNVPILTLYNKNTPNGSTFLDFKYNGQDAKQWRAGVEGSDDCFYIQYTPSGSSGFVKKVWATPTGEWWVDTDIYEGGTKLASKYLGISATAADSTKLNGQTASYYLNYNNLSNKPSAVLYTSQTLTDAQKTQARSNIGAGTGNGNVSGTGLVANYLVLGNGGSGVKTSTYLPAPSSTSWSDSSDVYIPTMKRIANVMLRMYRHSMRLEASSSGNTYRFITTVYNTNPSSADGSVQGFFAHLAGTLDSNGYSMEHMSVPLQLVQYASYGTYNWYFTDYQLRALYISGGYWQLEVNYNTDDATLALTGEIDSYFRGTRYYWSYSFNSAQISVYDDVSEV